MFDRTIPVSVRNIIDDLKAGPETVGDIDGDRPARKETRDILVDKIR